MSIQFSLSHQIGIDWTNQIPHHLHIYNDSSSQISLPFRFFVFILPSRIDWFGAIKASIVGTDFLVCRKLLSVLLALWFFPATFATVASINFTNRFGLIEYFFHFKQEGSKLLEGYSQKNIFLHLRWAITVGPIRDYDGNFAVNCDDWNNYPSAFLEIWTHPALDLRNGI